VIKSSSEHCNVPSVPQKCWTVLECGSGRSSREPQLLGVSGVLVVVMVVTVVVVNVRL
jgi:hypothetical protein